MRFGLNTLRLPTDVFWRTTLRELAVAMPETAYPPSPGELASLMRDHPDR